MACAHLRHDDSRSASLVIDGEVDVRTEADALFLLREVVERDIRHLTLDFTPATFADSAAVRLSMAARRELGRVGGSVTVVAPDEVRRIFELTHTSGLFRIAAPQRS